VVTLTNRVTGLRDDRGEEHTLTRVHGRKGQSRGRTRGIGKTFKKVPRRIRRGMQVHGTYSLLMGGMMVFRKIVDEVCLSFTP
jgi:hypothetical protein